MVNVFKPSFSFVSTMSVPLLILVLARTVIVSGATCPEPQVKPVPDSQEKLLKDYFQFKTSLYPIEANFKGVANGLSGSLPKFDEDCRVRVVKSARTFLERATLIQRWNFSLNDWEKFMVKILAWDSQEILDDFQGRLRYLSILDPFEGFQNTWPNQLGAAALKGDEDGEKYLETLASIPEALSGMMDTLRDGVKRGVVQDRATVELVRIQIQALAQEAIEDADLLRPVLNLPGFNERAIQIVQEDIQPAFKLMADFLGSEEYKPRASLGIGLDLYMGALKARTSLEVDPEQVHAMGLEYVQGLKEGVHSVIERLGLNMSFTEYSRLIRNDPEENFITRRSLFTQMKEIITEQINPNLNISLPDEYLTPDNLELNFEALDKDRLEFAVFEEGPRGQTGTLRINTNQLSTLKKFELKALLLSLANPGLNLQTNIRETHPLLPDFLALPLRPKFKAFSEGWALYSIYLGDEMDLFLQSKDLIGYYAAQLSAAADLVVDTGVHALDWSREQASTFLVENTFTDIPAAAMQLTKIVAQPGRASAAKLGERAIMKLRVRLERLADGSDFQESEFHKHLLQCTVPLDELEPCFDLLQQ